MTSRKITDTESAIRDLNRIKRLLTAEETLLREMLDICANQLDQLQQRRQTREAVIENWTQTYRRMAEEYFQTQSFWSGDRKLSVSDQIRRLDREAEDLAVLMSELVPHLRDDIEIPAIGASEVDKVSLTTAEDFEEVQCLPAGYISFSAVDEHGRRLGSDPAKDKPQSGIHEQSRRLDNYPEVAQLQDTTGYISLDAGTGTSGSSMVGVRTASRREARVFASQDRSEEVSVQSDDDMRTAIGYDTQALIGGRARFFVGSTPSAGGNIGSPSINQWRTVSVGNAARDQSWKTAKSHLGQPTRAATATDANQNMVPAYSMINSQNEFVLVPVLNFVDEAETLLRRLASVGLNEAQRLWQAELDASSGSSVRYTVEAPADSDEPQEVNRAHQLLTMLASTEDADRVPQNIRRSLLHRVLAWSPTESCEKNAEGKI